MTYLLVEPLPDLHDPALIVAFSGWNDAGEAASAAIRWLVRRLPAHRVGGFDAEVFHVFSDTRPTVRLVDGERHIKWPAHDLYFAPGSGARRDLLLLSSKEPELRWRTYCGELTALMDRHNVNLTVSLGGFLADAPHSRPVPISGFATTSDWWERLRANSVIPTAYQGPTGVIGALHDVCRRAGRPTFSLWAAVPHYLPNTANPKAALALLRRLDAMLELDLDLRRLENAASYFERQVDEAVSRDRRAGGYLRDLERRADMEGAADPSASPEPLPSAEEVIRDLEDFLRGRSEGGQG